MAAVEGTHVHEERVFAPRLSVGIGALPRLLTVEDVAHCLGMTTAWVYRKVKIGELPHIRIGNRIRFRTSDLDQWLQDHYPAS
jgi:excisionase family DNA binding protein